MADGCWGNQGLARENSDLRLEIQTLFRRLVSDADEASRSASIKLEDRECQTDADLAFEIPAVDKRIYSVVKELSYQAALHGEHTRRSLELDTKISALDTKSLELELELISPNSKVLELIGVAEKLQTQLDAASSGNSEVQREVDGLKETISLLTRSIHARDDALVEKQQRFEATRQTISGKCPRNIVFEYLS
jgi:chromosome segregation ATPase